MYTYKIPRHKVFISYHHNEDQEYKNYLIKLSEYNPITKRKQSIFDDYSIRENDVDDRGLSDEAVRKIIRDDYIRDASVLILLCGKRTKERKFIDWELHAAMFNTENKPKLGVVVINLPTINGCNGTHSGQDDEKPIIANPNSSWHKIKSRLQYEKEFPYLPSRIIDNYESAITDSSIVPITTVEWDVIEKDICTLKKLIDNAFKRSRDDSKHYNHSAPLRDRNSTSFNR